MTITPDVAGSRAGGASPPSLLHEVTVDASKPSAGGPAATGLPQTADDAGLETDYLIVGAGPSGASLACFLASYGLKGIMVSAAPGSANTPRAHITNIGAIECLRDIGLETELRQVASDGHCMEHTRWCHSMAGAEYARVYSWGHDPRRRGDYEMASPCSPVDLPQTLLEPVLLRRATHQGFRVRFDTALVAFDENPAAPRRYTATLRDKITGAAYCVRTKYIFGADGAHSQIAKQLQLPLIRKPGQGLAINVLVRTDLSDLVDARRGNLHWVMQPDRPHPAFGWMAIVRMVKPWHEWMFILFPSRDAALDADNKTNDDKSKAATVEQTTRAEYLQRVREMIGDGRPAEILDVSRWYINETVAAEYSSGNAYCLGDAVHRHPPMNGLGSNTCIQDAYNLAWKIAYVERGWAGPSLLGTYSTERQPVGKDVITRANQGFRDHFAVWDAMGTLPTDLEERRRILAELEAPTPAGAARRRAFREAIACTAHEFHGLGVEMGQLYQGPGIYASDEPQPYRRSGRAAEDPVLHYEPSTYPGCRLPHAWLNTAVPSKPKSTIDLAGHGRFVLFTGVGGGAWRDAAATVSAGLGGVPIGVHCVGFRQDWEDFYFEWERLRGVGETGAVLVRPDRFVAWRCQDSLGSASACATKLRTVMQSVLGLASREAPR